MTLIYFAEMTEISEFTLRTRYKELAKKFHPDKGGTTRIFQDIVNEYEWCLKNIGKVFESKKPVENFEDFLASIDEELYKKYLELKALDISVEVYNLEICGNWMWIETTKEFKDFFKGIGFKWAKEKKLWFYHSGDYKKHWGDSYSIDDIRNLHGSIKPERAFKKSLAG